MPGGCGRVIQRQECRRFIRRCLVHHVRNPNYEHNLLLTRWCAQHQLPWWFSQVKGEPLSWNRSLTSAPLSEPLTALRSTTLWTLSLYETAAGGGAATAGKNSRVGKPAEIISSPSFTSIPAAEVKPHPLVTPLWPTAGLKDMSVAGVQITDLISSLTLKSEVMGG